MIDAQHENSMSLRPLVNYITVCVLVVVDLSRILNLESSKYNNFLVLELTTGLHMFMYSISPNLNNYVPVVN